MAQVSGHSVAPHLDEHDDDAHAGHPGELTYIKVAAILALITVSEVVIYYVQWMHDSGALVPTLLVLSAIKFATVIAYFMHLKFEKFSLFLTLFPMLIFCILMMFVFMPDSMRAMLMRTQ